jgi:hypothetical protein
MLLEKLPCKLNDDEVRRKGEELALARKKHHEVADEAKSSAAEFKDRLKKIDTQIDLLAEQVRSKRETREVEVIERKDLDAAMVETIRTDTGEIVRARAMSLQERQIHLFSPGMRLAEDPKEEPASEAG